MPATAAPTWGKNGTRRAGAAALLVLLALPAAAHVLNTDLSKLSRTEIFGTYLRLGFTHIIPLGSTTFFLFSASTFWSRG